MRQLLERWRPLVEKHLAEAGPNYGSLLLITLLLWVTVVLGVLLYAAAMGVWTVARWSWAARSLEPVDVSVAVVLWAFLALSALLAKNLRRIWLQRRDERWAAEVGLTRIEERAFPGQPTTAYLEEPRERLAHRGLEDLERRLLGKLQSEDLGVEERLIALDRATRPGGE